jgi:hypothetical protein
MFWTQVNNSVVSYMCIEIRLVINNYSSPYHERPFSISVIFEVQAGVKALMSSTPHSSVPKEGSVCGVLKEHC